MKKVMKYTMCTVLTMCMLICNFIGISATYNSESHENMIIYDEYISTSVENNIIKKSVSETNLNELYSSLKKEYADKYEQNVKILKSLGYSDEIISAMTPDAINGILENAKSISTEIKYMKSNSDGTFTVISEDEALTMAEQQKNGCMRITLSNVYIDSNSKNGQKGWFDIHAWFEWLVPDDRRNTDTIYIIANDCAWTDRLVEDYSSSFLYKIRDINGNDGIYGESTDGSKIQWFSNGASCTWPMPKDSGVYTKVTYVQYYIGAKARIKYYTEVEECASFAYCEHGTSKTANENIQENQFSVSFPITSPVVQLALYLLICISSIQKNFGE